MAKLILPQIQNIQICGFNPTFSQDLGFSLKCGFNVILGGNGLGKTTILQATVYALTGGATEGVESIKSKRWDHRYFKGRISEQFLRGAKVEATFCFDEKHISVRRGFANSKVWAVKCDSDADWVTKDAEVYYAELLQTHGGYDSVDDFGFVVHKLLYMPESRNLLAWDLDAQVRLLMLLCGDVIDEGDFRALREELRYLDSKKRHAYVAIGKAEKEIESLRSEYKAQKRSVAVIPGRDKIENLEELVKELSVAVKERHELEARLNGFRSDLSANTREIEKIQETLGDEEARLIEVSIGKHESGAHLALNKLVENSICPACGSKAIELQKVARENLKVCGCVLCGTKTEAKGGAKLATLYSQLVEKSRAQLRLEKEVQELILNIEQKQESELKVKKQIDAIRYKDSFVLVPKTDAKPGTEKYLLGGLAKLRIEHAQLEAKGEELSRMLEERYAQFFSTIGARVDNLKKLYSSYSSAFLGVNCELTEHQSQDTFLPLKIFVPTFNAQARPTPESCSEAQRFFLDIAFRLAMIALASELSETKAAFMCETPETALDLSYEGNVVKMFHEFSRNGHVLLLTANIQHNGLAAAMLKMEAKRERESRMLNLLKYGRLSDVQANAKLELEKAVLAIVS